MYRIAVPVMLTSPTYDREAILRDLRRAGATRVFLAIPPFVPDEEKQNSIFECLSREISGFRENGVEVGVWFWTFWVDADMGFTRMTGVTGKESPTECCPLDGKFLDFALRNIARIASMHPDLIQFDDDFRFGMQNCGRGCVCRLHRKKITELVGKELPAGDVSEILLGGKPNAFRSAFIRANGDSLRGFAKAVRETVDKVDPAIRVGQCACIGTYDLDGTDSFEISRILAGKTAPFLRLIGAPYWAAEKQWGNRLQDVIELERIQRSWGGEGIEIFAEGDAYPRPRFHTPASYVELFDAALRVDGSLDGILKYMADYTSSASYETGYFDRHVADEN
ncbi:MAG: hypothetical protein MJ082_04890, partial [Clostridia bacterium]|nr:hypothetical protein [Clostridia bacterium]